MEEICNKRTQLEMKRIKMAKASYDSNTININEFIHSKTKMDKYNNVPISTRINEAFERADELSKNSISSYKSINNKVNDSSNKVNKVIIKTKLIPSKNNIKIKHNYYDAHFNNESVPNTERYHNNNQNNSVNKT